MNRQIVVTGASSGIGSETTNILRKQGAYVIGIDRTPTSNADLHITADLSTPQGVDQALDELDAIGGVAGLCNIAGVPGTMPPHVVLSVNVQAPKRLFGSLAPRLDGMGACVNVASQAGSAWAANLGLIREYLAIDDWEAANSWVLDRLPDEYNVYAFSKECLIVLTQLQAASMLPRGPRTNSVSPGPVQTPILQDFRADLGREKTQEAHDVVGRWGTPHDIGAVVAQLLDPEAAGWINGVNIPVDGGLGAFRSVASFTTEGPRT